MTDADEEKRARNGSLAAWIFIFSALYFFITDGGIESLISIEVLAFFIIGMIASAVVIGMPTYVLQRGVGKVVLKSIDDPFSQQAVLRIKIVRFILMLVQMAITVFVTKLAYEWFIT